MSMSAQEKAEQSLKTELSILRAQMEEVSVRLALTSPAFFMVFADE